MMMTVGKIISQPQILLPLLLLKASIIPKVFQSVQHVAFYESTERIIANL